MSVTHEMLFCVLMTDCDGHQSNVRLQWFCRFSAVSHQELTCVSLCSADGDWTAVQRQQQ